MLWSGLESFTVEEIYSCLYCSIGEIIVFTRYKIGSRQTHRANAIGPLMFVLKRFDWISFILPQSRVTCYYYGVPCLFLSTSNHYILAPYILRISVVVGTRCRTQQCICLHFNTCLLFLLCCVVLDNRGLVTL